MPTFKPAYLIHGDDHGRIAERRARLRSLAEAGSGAGGLELFEGERSTPEQVAASLSMMTFAVGRRFLIVDGVERWKDKELESLEAVMAAMPPETTAAFFAREDNRTKAPQRLVDAVGKAGGDISAENSVKAWELPKWVMAHGRELGLDLDPEAARALVAQVGERQQRLLRELEKLALWRGEAGRIDPDDVDELTARSAERRAWSLADALLASDATAAARLYLSLRQQGERLPSLIYWMAQRLRQGLEVAEALEAGESAGQIKRRLRMPSKAADRLIADARQRGVEWLKQGVEEIAELEVASRGGSRGLAAEDTAALRAIARIAA